MISKNFKMVHIRTKTGPRDKDFFILWQLSFLICIVMLLIKLRK